MIIRFLDTKETVFQVDSHKTPVLIYLESQAEVDYVRQLDLGGCLISIPNSFDEETTKRIYGKLNSKDEPKNLK